MMILYNIKYIYEMEDCHLKLLPIFENEIQESLSKRKTDNFPFPLDDDDDLT